MTTRIYYATDLHGSEKCFLKFLNAAKVYKAKILILGGDVTGKVIVPLVKDGKGGYRAAVRGLGRSAKNESEAQELEKEIRFIGYYPYRIDPEEMARLQKDEAAVHSIFVKLMLDNFRRWVQLAGERLRDSGVKMYLTGGNDDINEIKPIIAESDYVVDPEDRVVDLDGKHEMISSGLSNPTPWKTPRECSEEELWEKMESMASQVKDMKNCVFNLHVPPIESGLDECPKLDENLKPMYAGTEPITQPCGSTSVRKAIEKHQPLLGLHGHVHESRGFIQIGRTLCFNAGSESSEGILRGVIADLDDGSVKSYLLTQG